jgi:hypothetical protein
MEGQAMSEGLVEAGTERVASAAPSVARQRRAVAAWWYPAMIGGLAGALIAIVVMERQLQAALELRPPVMVADYATFLAELARGVDARAVQLHADRYTARAEDLARQGVLVLRSDALVGTAPVMGVPNDLPAADPAGAAPLAAGPPAVGLPAVDRRASPGPAETRPAASGPAAGGTPGTPGGISPNDAAALMSALRAVR